MTQAEAALVDLVRLVIRGEHESIPRRVRKLIGAAAGRRPNALSDECRRALAEVLQEEGEPRRGLAMRRTASTGVEDRPVVEVAEDPVLDTPPPILADHIRGPLEQLIAEHRAHVELENAGLHPTRTVLLAGAPGVGKTMTVTWLAQQLRLPLLRAEPSAIITSLLGESARNLAAAFELARSRPCVFLLDEVDAFAKRRDDEHDVGELKRFVTTLLVELERWPPGNLLVAATNHPQLLDPALDRRFELRLEIPLPDEGARTAIVSRQLDRLDTHVPSQALRALVQLTDGRSGSELDTVVLRAVRESILQHRPLETALLHSALPPDPTELPREAKRVFAERARDAGMTTRAIGKLLGTSHAAVSRMTRPASAEV